MPPVVRILRKILAIAMRVAENFDVELILKELNSLWEFKTKV